MPNRNSRQPSLGRVYDRMPELRPIAATNMLPVVTNADGSRRWADAGETRVLNMYGPDALNNRPPDREFRPQSMLTPRQAALLAQQSRPNPFQPQTQSRDPVSSYTAHSRATQAQVQAPGSHPKFFGEPRRPAIRPPSKPAPKKGLLSRLGSKVARHLDDSESVSGECHVCRQLSYQGSLEGSTTFAISERELFSSAPDIGASESCIYCALLGQIVEEHQSRGFLCNMVDVSIAYGKPIVLRFFAPEFAAVGHLQPNDERAIAFVHKIEDPNQPTTPHINDDYNSARSFDTTVVRLPRLGYAQDFSQDLGSDYCFNFLQASLEQCASQGNASHAACWKGYSTKTLPTRLLDLANGQVRLVPTPARGDYCILSYSWGTSGNNLTTTTNTLSRRRIGISWADLPAVHQDAITLTRRLGIQYLWIDSLCIVQYDPNGANDAADFGQEGQKMAQYYGNAYLTIVAADCEDPGLSFLRPRDPKAFYQSENRVHTLGRWTRSSLVCRSFPPAGEAQGAAMTNGTKLARRGWTYQENILSKRLVHFTSSEVMWECVTCQRFEFGVELTSPVGLAHRFELARSSGTPDKYDQFWRLFVTAYSDRLLTKEKDRIVAMYGVANRLHHESQLTPGAFLFGLWGAYLARHMLWRAKIATGSRSAGGLGYDKLAWGIPSWSWMSTTASVEYEATTSQARVESMIDAWSLGPTVAPSLVLQELDHRLGVKGYTGWVKLLAYQPKASSDSPSFILDFTRERATSHLGHVSMTADTHLAPVALPYDSTDRSSATYMSARRLGGSLDESNNQEIFETETCPQEPFEAWVVVLWMATYYCRYTLDVEEALIRSDSRYRYGSGHPEKVGYYGLVLSLAEEGGHAYRRLGFMQTMKLPDFAGIEKSEIELM